MKIVDGALRGRPGKFIVDYRDRSGDRRTPSFDTRTEAEEFLINEAGFQRNTQTGAVSANISFKEYVVRCEQVWKNEESEEGTIKGHLQVLRDHILPYFTKNLARISQPNREDVLRFRQHLFKKRPRGGKYNKPLKTKHFLGKSTVKNILNTLSSIFSIAVEDGVRSDNPAARLGRRKGRRAHEEERHRPIEVSKALTKKERDRVLVAAYLFLNDLHYAALCLLAGTGIRPGEARALQWKHFDLDGSQGIHDGVPMIRIEQGFKRSGAIGCTKGKENREVEIEATLCELFRRLKQSSQPHPDDFVLSEDGGTTPLLDAELAKGWPYLLGFAGINRWLPIYCLRHTYASILVREGLSLTYVSRQLGHASTATTEKYYAHWLPQYANGALTKLGLATAIRLNR